MRACASGAAARMVVASRPTRPACASLRCRGCCVAKDTRTRTYAAPLATPPIVALPIFSSPGEVLMVDKVVADGIPEIQDTEMLTGEVRCDNPIRRSLLRSTDRRSQQPVPNYRVSLQG